MAPAHCGGTPELPSIPESLPRLRSDRASSRPRFLQVLAAVPGPSSLLDSGIINMKRRQEASYLTTWKLVSGNINRERTNLSLTHLLHTHNQSFRICRGWGAHLHTRRKGWEALVSHPLFQLSGLV